MTNKEIIPAFVANKSKNYYAHANSLTIREGKLFSYNTCIAQHDGSRLIINDTKYSVTTSKQQNYLRYAAEVHPEVVHVKDIPRNAQSLI